MRIICIERSLTEVRGHLHFGQPKTAATRRAVTLPTWPQVCPEADRSFQSRVVDHGDF